MDGQIQGEGTPQTLYQNIGSVRAAKFLGLNILEGTVTETTVNTVKITSGSNEITLTAPKPNTNIKKGDKVLALFRPDDIILANDQSKKENEITAKVTKISLIKCNVILALKTPKGHVIKAELGRGHLMTIGKLPKEGTTIRVKIPSHLITLAKMKQSTQEPTL